MNKLGLIRRSLLAVAVVVGGGVVAIGPAQASTPAPLGVRYHKIGNPTWEPVGYTQFSAPIGTAASGYAEFLQTQLGLLPNHAFHPQLIVGPGAPHQPPYTHEMSDGVTAQGYDTSGPFLPSQFSAGQAVWVAWMVVPRPGSALGSSPDFAAGPIIPNSVFPIHFTGVTNRNGSVWDPFLGTFDIPALNDPSLTPSYAVDGASHFPIFVADNADFGPSGGRLPGNYNFQMTMTDVNGNGWNITATFRVHS